jgi:hypothetical protein
VLLMKTKNGLAVLGRTLDLRLLEKRGVRVFLSAGWYRLGQKSEGETMWLGFFSVSPDNMVFVSGVCWSMTVTMSGTFITVALAQRTVKGRGCVLCNLVPTSGGVIGHLLLWLSRQERLIPGNWYRVAPMAGKASCGSCGSGITTANQCSVFLPFYKEMEPVIMGA